MRQVFDMDITIHPGKIGGSVTAIPSKSQAHRMLICAAFADGPTKLICPETNEDIESTADCLRALGAVIRRTAEGYEIIPAKEFVQDAYLNCHESGSTLRFLLPIVGALGMKATVKMEGRLPCRPLSPLWEEMARMGCTLSRPDDNTILCEGKLQSGEYTIPGNVSSQFITGLLLAFRLMDAPSTLNVTGTLESAPYIEMTKQVMDLFPNRHTPGKLTVEGDWSNGAFFLAAKELGSEVSVENLSENSAQGDRAAAFWLPKLKQHCTISAADIPDLVPILSVVAAVNQGAVFTDIRRLRLKESDRVASVISMLEALGGKAEAAEDTLTVYGTGLVGGIVSSCNDHRIAMSAAIAATVCKKDVTILSAECVSKSYPKFFEEYRHLGGNYEQHLR